MCWLQEDTIWGNRAWPVVAGEASQVLVGGVQEIAWQSPKSLVMLVTICY